MFRNYLKIAVRSLRKNSAYVLINTLGLGMALACGIIAYLNYEFDANWDHQNEHLNEIYRVQSIRDVQGDLQPYGITPNQVSNQMEVDAPENAEVVRTVFEYLGARIGDEVFNSNVIYTDPSFLDVFTIEKVAGSLGSLDRNSEMIITESASKKFFGDESAIGKVVEQIVRNETRSYEVVAVIRDFPMNSSFSNFETIVLRDNYRYIDEDFETRPWNYWNTTFLWVKDNHDLLTLANQLKSYIPAQNKARPDFLVKRFELEKLDGMAARARDGDIHSHWMPQAMPKAAVIGPSVMAILLLLLACFNYTNISIAMSGSRLKEIGLRKVMGGRRKQLIFQFIVENMLMTFIALLVGIVIAELLIPVYNNMWDFVKLDLIFRDNYSFLAFLMLLVLSVGLIAGSYPAFYISGFEPTPILRGTFKLGGNTALSKTLLVMQLSISLIALIAAFAFYSNATYQQNLDLGYNNKQILTTFVNNGKEYEQLKTALEKYPDILEVGGTKHMFLSYNTDRKISYEGKEFITEEFDVGENFFDIMDIQVIKGDDFSDRSVTDETSSIIVNESFLKYYGIEDQPIGKKVMLSDTISSYIKGVIGDTYYYGFWDPIEPAIFRLTPEESYERLIVKASEDNLPKVDEYIAHEYKTLFPNRIYNSIYLSYDVKEAIDVGKNVIRMFAFLGGVALLLSITGLYAMVSLNILKRTKEIGIRKVLGATVAGLVQKLNTPYLILIVFSVFLGCAAGYYLTGALLDLIWVYHTPLTPRVFLYASVILLFITGVTITGKVLVAAMGKPVNALRSE